MDHHVCTFSPAYVQLDRWIAAGLCYMYADVAQHVCIDALFRPDFRAFDVPLNMAMQSCVHLSCCNTVGAP